MSTPPTGQYADDAPIHTKADDRFSRWAFSERTAHVIATRKDASSLVLAIYGPWGDGKTSVLNMMAEALKAHPGVVLIRFNPWHFESHEQLIRAFFDTLADAAGKNLKTTGQAIGEIFKRYGGLLSIASVSIAGGLAQVSPGEGLKHLGEQLSNVDLDDLKAQLDERLVESGKQIIVLIDDVDRLDRSEIHALLKLVKLSGSFSNTSYVIACDDDVVAASLGERYGAGGITAGRQFMEKIIQVPLHLPNAESDDLRTLAFEGVDDVLKQNEITLSAQEVEAFVRHFSVGILPMLSTPRQVKRYVNAIRFAIPLLKDEVRVVDQLLIEALRVVFPNLYLAIRANEELYVGESSDRSHGSDKAKAKAHIEEHVKDLTEDAKTAARHVLLALFPRTGNTGYGNDWDAIWAREKRITSDDYFRRYFQYAVPQRDIADSHIDGLLAASRSSDAASVRTALDEITLRGAWQRAIDKLFARSKGTDDQAYATLAVSIAKHADKLPNEQGPFASFLSTSSRAAMFIGHIVKRIQDQNLRMSTATEVVNGAASLAFAADCFRWFQVDRKEETDIHTFSDDERQAIGSALASRISQTAEQAPDLSALGPTLPSVLWNWKKYGPPEQAAQFLQKRIAEHPEDAVKFLNTLVGRAWGLEDGLSLQAEFEREAYNAAVELVDVDVLMNALKTVYGHKVERYTFDKRWELSGDERLACGFVAVHRHVQVEKSKAAQEAQVPPSDVAAEPTTD